MRKEKIMAIAKGYRGRAKNCPTIAVKRVHKGLEYAYVSRKLKKRDFRKSWIENMNAASREYGLAYSTFVNGCKRQNIDLNRKVLADIAQTEPFSFRAVVEVIKQLNVRTISPLVKEPATEALTKEDKPL